LAGSTVSPACNFSTALLAVVQLIPLKEP